MHTSQAVIRGLTFWVHSKVWCVSDIYIYIYIYICVCMLVGNNNGYTEGTGIMFLTDISVGDWFYS